MHLEAVFSIDVHVKVILGKPVTILASNLKLLVNSNIIVKERCRISHNRKLVPRFAINVLQLQLGDAT
jgi:hypothetical protein